MGRTDFGKNSFGRAMGQKVDCNRLRVVPVGGKKMQSKRENFFKKFRGK